MVSNNKIRKTISAKVTGFLLAFCCVLVVFSASAQNKKIKDDKKLKEADGFYEEKEYYKALEGYKATQKETNTPEIKAKIADCYRLTKNTVAAEKCYSEIVNGPDKKSSSLFYYAESLKSNGKIAEAKTWYGEYLKLEPNDKNATTLFNSCSVYVDSVNTIKCIYIQNQQSFLNFDAPEGGKIYVPVIFDASKITINNEKITEYYWDFEDNSSGLGGKINHKFSENRPYIVRLIVTTELQNGSSSIHCSYKKIDIRPNYKPGNNNLLDIQKKDADQREKKSDKQQ